MSTETHTHIMVDLETLGVRPGSAIASIGAVVFDPQTGALGREFYRTIKLASCESAGLTFDASTIEWWLRQSDAARGELAGSTAILDDVLCEFREFWAAENAGYIWCHGANFDEPLLVAAYQAFNYVAPWGYWGVRCTRTLYALAGVKPDRTEGTHHNALDDAKAQARAVAEAYRKLRLAGDDPAAGVRLVEGTPLHDIAAECGRQVREEGFTAEHDDHHSHGELARAAASYSLSAAGASGGGEWLERFAAALWPWDFKWWKPKRARRDLVRAGALIVAEIARLDRQAARP